MTKALVTIIEGDDHEQFAEITLPTFERYADRYGYDIVIAETDPDLPTPHWSKALALRQALEDYEIAVWLDIDSLVTGSAPDIANYLTDGLAFQALPFLNYEPEGNTQDAQAALGTKLTLIDTGVWAVQQHPDAIRFLDEFIEQRDLYELEEGRLGTSAIRRLLGDDDPEEAARRGWWPYVVGTVLLREIWNARLYWFARHPGCVPHIFHAASIYGREHPDYAQDTQLRVDLLQKVWSSGV
jgi:hypothetical protein